MGRKRLNDNTPPYYIAAEVMRKKKITYPILSERLGMSIGGTFLIVNGNPSIENVMRLSKALGCHFWGLFDFSKVGMKRK